LRSADDNADDYIHENPNLAQDYIYPAVVQELERNTSIRTIFEIGVGTGDVLQRLSDSGFKVFGIDPSINGINQARAKYPMLPVENASAYDRLADKYGMWDAVLSLEVIEHLYRPHTFARTAFDLLRPGGLFVLSTPFHGYWKNLALAATGMMDQHFMALREHGHIKFWSAKTIYELLADTGFKQIKIVRTGRVPAFAKSMVVFATKPDE